MSTVIANTQFMRVARFYDSTIGKKAVMAVTGLILFGFLIAHMLGNLQIFLGPTVMNHYAETLHGNPALLWTARTVLLVSVLLHIWASISAGHAQKRGTAGRLCKTRQRAVELGIAHDDVERPDHRRIRRLSSASPDDGYDPSAIRSRFMRMKISSTASWSSRLRSYISS